jgi:hypothetical protein
MKKIITQILQLDCFIANPPVLVDIGASGSLPKQWKYLSPFSIGVAFDADDRDFQVAESINNGWRKLYSLNRLVTPVSSNSVDFYLTKSPHCSSSLLPDTEKLQPWAFSALFAIEEIVQLPSIDLSSALKDVGISHIDWYKSDTQGADLRIFKSLPSKVINDIVVAEFEPGIINAYVGEDKLYSLMEFMDKLPFWVSDMVIKGSQRIYKETLTELNFLQKTSPSSFIKTSPGWCEIAYINTCDIDGLTLRKCLLAWIFASIKGQHAFAIQLAIQGRKQFDNNIFIDLLTFSRRELIKSYPKFLLRIIKRALLIKLG